MKCHCGLECSTHQIDFPLREYNSCPKHGFQGWVDTKGYEYIETAKCRKCNKPMKKDQWVCCI